MFNQGSALAYRVVPGLLTITLLLFCVEKSNASASYFCCPGCIPTASETRAETVARSDAVVLMQFVESDPGDDETEASSTYEVTLVGKDATEQLKPGDRIRLDNYREADPGDLFFLNGLQNEEETIDWEAPAEVTETGYHYVMQAPSPELPRHKRLPYYVKFLEFPDNFIADDAYNEFAFAPFEDVATLTDILPREKLITYLQDEKTPQSRIGLYGILLGLCGTDADARLLGDKFFLEAEQYVFGMEGIVTGYLFLTREEGLDKIRNEILATQDKSVDYLYPLMRALRIVWTYGQERVSKPALILAMRSFLKHERLDELVIPDLARWKDWEPIDELIQKYENHTEKKDESLKRAILIYLMECGNQPADGEGQLPLTAQKAESFLDRVREEDPVLLKKVRRFHRVKPPETTESKTSEEETVE